MKIKKVAILAPVPAPYRAFEYDNVQKELINKYKFKCFFLERSFDLKWRDCTPKVMEFTFFEMSKLVNFFRKFERSLRINRHVLKKLREFNPDVVITHGYDSPTMITAVLWAKLHGRKVLFRSDSNYLKVLREPFALYKKLYIKTYLRMVDAFLTIGSRNEEFYKYFNVAPKKFFRGSYVVDSDFYQNISEKVKADKSAFLEKYKISHGRVILFVGRLLKCKSLDILLEAFIRIKQTPGHDDLGLIIAGDGPEKERLETLAEPVKDSVYFPGFVQPEQVAELMGLSDLFILPSRREQWGLVVNEAMQSALPIIISSQVGSAVDMVDPGVNGFIFEVDNVAGLVDNITTIVDNAELNHSMSIESRDRINQWNDKYNVAEAYANALASVE